MSLRLLFYTLVLSFAVFSLFSCATREVRYTTQSGAHNYSPYKNMKYDRVTVKEKKPGSKRK